MSGHGNELSPPCIREDELDIRHRRGLIVQHQSQNTSAVRLVMEAEKEPGSSGIGVHITVALSGIGLDVSISNPFLISAAVMVLIRGTLAYTFCGM